MVLRGPSTVKHLGRVLLNRKYGAQFTDTARDAQRRHLTVPVTVSNHTMVSCVLVMTVTTNTVMTGEDKTGQQPRAKIFRISFRCTVQYSTLLLPTVLELYAQCA